MRTRESRRRQDELAAVVRWLRARADGWLADATALERLERPSLAPTVARWRAEAVALREAADALERGEHHDKG